MIAGFRTLAAPLGLIAFLSGSCLPGCKSDEPSNGDSKAGSPSATAGNAQGGAGGGAGAGSPGPRKIITIGDSITRATCWRAKLWQTLNGTHAGKFDLVGTLKADSGCNVAGYDQDNQGYSSSLLTEVVAGVTNARTCDPKCPTLADFAAAFTVTTPDIALIHYGTNDVWNGKPTNDITAGYSALVDQLRAANPNVTVLIAKIIPMNVTDGTCGGCSCASCTTAIPTLNTAIDAWATSKATTASAIVVVDQFTGFDATADTRDGVHPNDAGSQKMAAKWAAALEPLF